MIVVHGDGSFPYAAKLYRRAQRLVKEKWESLADTQKPGGRNFSKDGNCYLLKDFGSFARSPLVGKEPPNRL